LEAWTKRGRFDPSSSGHDYRYVRYVTADAELTRAPEAFPRTTGKKPGDVMVLTTDMEVETQRLIKDGWIQATVVSQPVTMAELAVQRAIEAAEGKKIPKETSRKQA
jgi:ABC-type sugar transport system substrate-binding protein